MPPRGPPLAVGLPGVVPVLAPGLVTPGVSVPQVYQLGGICKLVDLLRSANQNVQQAAAGALRNLVFRSVPNKLETRRQGGIREAVSLLRRSGSTEIQKQLTGRQPAGRRAAWAAGVLAAAPDRWARHRGRPQADVPGVRGTGRVCGVQVVTLGIACAHSGWKAGVRTPGLSGDTE